LPPRQGPSCGIPFQCLDFLAKYAKSAVGQCGVLPRFDSTRLADSAPWCATMAVGLHVTWHPQGLHRKKYLKFLASMLHFQFYNWKFRKKWKFNVYF